MFGWRTMNTRCSQCIWKHNPPRPSQSFLRRAWNRVPNWPSLVLCPRIGNTCSDNVLVPQQGRWPPATVAKSFSWDCRSPTEAKEDQRFSFGVCTKIGRCQRKDQEVRREWSAMLTVDKLGRRDRCVSSSFSLQVQIYVGSDVNLMAMA